MDAATMTVLDLHKRLLRFYGPQDAWWPGRENPFEVIVGAILTQRTSWANVRTAIAQLREAGLLSPAAMARADTTALEETIRSAGFFRAKTRKLKAFCRRLCDDYEGDLARLFALPTKPLRDVLLSVHGIGDETADAILVYAANRASFVIDAYTGRLLARLKMAGPEESYRSLQRRFMDALPPDAALFAEYHALLVEHGRTHCRRQPRCAGCPLTAVCPWAQAPGG